MPQWKYSVDVRPFFHQEWQTFEESRDGIVQVIKDSAWYRDHEDSVAIMSSLHYLMLELQFMDNPEEFDLVWDDIYNLANETRCWIMTV